MTKNELRLRILNALDHIVDKESGLTLGNALAEAKERYGQSYFKTLVNWYAPWGLIFRVGAWICKHQGCNLVDNGSYATGDSAADCVRCTRCGTEHSHTYY